MTDFWVFLDITALIGKIGQGLCNGAFPTKFQPQIRAYALGLGYIQHRYLQTKVRFLHLDYFKYLL